MERSGQTNTVSALYSGVDLCSFQSSLPYNNIRMSFHLKLKFRPPSFPHVRNGMMTYDLISLMGILRP